MSENISLPVDKYNIILAKCAEIRQKISNARQDLSGEMRNELIREERESKLFLRQQGAD